MDILHSVRPDDSDIWVGDVGRNPLHDTESWGVPPLGVNKDNLKTPTSSAVHDLEVPLI